MPAPKKQTQDIAKSAAIKTAKEVKDTAKLLYEESKELVKGVIADLAHPSMHNGEGLNLANALDAIAGFVKGYLDWREAEKKKEKEAAEKEKEQQKGGKQAGGSFGMEDIAKFLGTDAAKSLLSPETLGKFMKSDAIGDLLKSDTVKSLLDSEVVGNALKEFSGAITQNADLIKSVCPKDLADKLFAFTVPANAASQGLKKPENANKSVSQLIDYSPGSIRSNPQGYKALYDRSKGIIDSAPDLKNANKNPQLKSAMLSMAKIGPVLSQADPSLSNQVAKDFRANMVKSPSFRNMAVDSAQSRLKGINSQQYAKMTPELQGQVNFDVKTCLLASALNRGLTDQKAIFDDVNKNFEAFQKDPEKGLKALSGKNTMERANQRMQFRQQNPNNIQAQPINGSPIPKVDGELKQNMLSSRFAREDRLNEAQSHLKEVLTKTGARTKEDIDKLPQGLKDEISKDVNTIVYAHTANAALNSKGIKAMNNPDATKQFANSKDINGLVNDTSKAFFETPGADFTALLDNKQMAKMGQEAVDLNKDMFKENLNKEPSRAESTIKFDDQVKDDMLKNRALRAEKVQQAQEYLKDFADKNQLSSKEDFDKLKPADKEALDNCIKTIGYGHAAEAAFKQSGQMGIPDPNVRKELANSKGLTNATNSTLENFHKNPTQNLGNVLNNKKMQNLGNTLMKDNINEFKGISQKTPAPSINQKEPAPNVTQKNPAEAMPTRKFVANPQLGVKPIARNTAPKPEGPMPFSAMKQNDMMRSPALRAENMKQAQEHLKGILEKNGGLENPDLSKLSPAVKESIQNDVKTIAFGSAVNNLVGEKGKVNTFDTMNQVHQSKEIQNFVNTSAQQFMEHPGPNANIVLNDDMLKKTSEMALKGNKEELKDVVQHSEAKNEEPLESFDDNLKRDMLKSKAFRDEKVNEAQEHLKNTMEQNGVKSVDDYNKLTKTVQASMDRDVKTILYGHVADQALSQNGLQEIKDPAVQSKFNNSRQTNFLVNEGAKNFSKDPAGLTNVLLDNNAIQQQVSNSKADFSQELKKETFDRELQENMLKSPAFRKQAIENATNSLQGMLGAEGKMTSEKYVGMTGEQRERFDANVKTIAFGQMANRALKENGVKSISDPKAIDQLINSKTLTSFTNDVMKNVQKDPSSISKVMDDKEMRRASKNSYDFGKNKEEIQGIMLDDNFDLKKGIGASLQ